MKLLDHRNLDKDVDFFRTRPSTVENICVFVWRQLADEISAASPTCRLVKVKVHETENNSAVYTGGE